MRAGGHSALGMLLKGTAVEPLGEGLTQITDDGCQHLQQSWQQCQGRCYGPEQTAWEPILVWQVHMAPGGW